MDAIEKWLLGQTPLVAVLAFYNIIQWRKAEKQSKKSEEIAGEFIKLATMWEAKLDKMDLINGNEQKELIAKLDTIIQLLHGKRRI